MGAVKVAEGAHCLNPLTPAISRPDTNTLQAIEALGDISHHLTTDYCVLRQSSECRCRASCDIELIWLMRKWSSLVLLQCTVCRVHVVLICVHLNEQLMTVVDIGSINENKKCSQVV